MHRKNALIAGFALAVWACSKTEPETATAPAARDPIDVEVQQVELGELQRYVQATGTLFGEEQTVVSAEVAGRIDTVYRDVGAEVLPGDPLVRIDATEYSLAVAERKRAFEQALAVLGLDELPAAEFDVTSLPSVERARLRAENERARFDRGEILHKRTPPAVSDQDFADMRTAWDVAQTEQRLAELEARAKLAEARALHARLATAEEVLIDTLHVVPKGLRQPVADIDGLAPRKIQFVVTRRIASVGDYVQIGAPLFELIDPDPLELRVATRERDIARVHVGQRASLTVDAYERVFEGRVARINPAVDARTRTFEIEIDVPNADRALRAGSFARVAIEVERDTDVVLVPRSAVSTFAGVHKVFLVVDGVAVERGVALGVEDGERVEITKGLEVGETFVREIPAGLAGGMPVRVKTP